MRNLTRFDPLADLAQWNRPFFDLFEQASKNIFLPETFPATFQKGIKIDVTEEGPAYVVRAEIPGVKKEDIKVAVDGCNVTITAEVKEETEKKNGGKMLRHECFFGSTQRTFVLDQPVSEEGVKAAYADGVLSLTLPKKAGAVGKQIVIN